ncbi:stage V sporulation protein SpoVM [Thermicanus aegyptius]|nr:stage V sporulation protein SpoVM [Thermicanus aegyptius]MBE3554083.1 stage V sporulation protein SpoVM [Thermicanus sp.]
MRFYTIKLPKAISVVVRFIIQTFSRETKKKVVKK